MAVQQALMTVEEFWERYADKPYELINGEVVETVPTGLEHGEIIVAISAVLSQYVKANRLGKVFAGEVGVQLGPSILRAVDVAFVGNQRLSAITDPSKYVPFAPDLAVEVISPGNQASDIQLKVSQYLKGGVLLVWMVYPARNQVVVYDSEGEVKTLSENDTLDGGKVLAGFSVPVKELFPQD